LEEVLDGCKAYAARKMSVGFAIRKFDIMKNTNAQPKGNGNRHLDEKDLTAIFDQFAPAIYKYALRLCHDPDVADHIVGDAFAQLLEQFVIGKGPRPEPRSYLYQTAYRSIVKYLRDSPHNPSTEPVVSTADQSQPQDDKEALISALNNELTEDERQVLILYFLEDFNLKETAKILERSVGEIRSSLRKIRKIIENHPELLTDSLAALWNKKKRKRKPK
jgi:RNA polymerase sigma-70 factor (ECF subfamily)